MLKIVPEVNKGVFEVVYGGSDARREDRCEVGCGAVMAKTCFVLAGVSILFCLGTGGDAGFVADLEGVLIGRVEDAMLNQDLAGLAQC
jgi:hypothetical protein